MSSHHDIIDGPGLDDVIGLDEPYLVMWLRLLAKPGGYTKWLSQWLRWLHFLAQPLRVSGVLKVAKARH